MANSGIDPKAAPLADDLKDLAFSLPTSVFPKSFFCALCSQLAIDSWKLLCCNKTICLSCQAKFEFPTTCPSCEHSPLEADSCVPNKALRSTMRVWLQKQKKKEEAKAAVKTIAPLAEVTEGAEVQPVDEDAPAGTEEAVVSPIDGEHDKAGLDIENPGPQDAATALQAQEIPSATLNEGQEQPQNETVDVAAQSDSKISESMSVQNDLQETSNAEYDENSAMNTQRLSNQMGYTFPQNGAFNMGWNNMNNGMAWNGVNTIDFNMNGMSNGMFNNFGGNMGMGMNDMSAMNMMNYGGGFGNGYNGMGGGFGNYNAFSQMAGYNQSGAYSGMMNQYPKNNYQNQNQTRFHARQGGTYSQRYPMQGNHGDQGMQNRSGSRVGPQQNVRRAHQASPGNYSEVSTSPETKANDDFPKQCDDQSLDGRADVTNEVKADADLNSPTGGAEEGEKTSHNVVASADASTLDGTPNANAAATTAESAELNLASKSSEPHLSQVQILKSGTEGGHGLESGMNDGMQSNVAYREDLGNQYSHSGQQMDASFDPRMTMNMGFANTNDYGARGSFNKGAYGAATVLTGQPTGVGVVGAPTGPRAMREGRANSGYMSRANRNRHSGPLSYAMPTQDDETRKPSRRTRSRSPERQEKSLGTDKKRSSSRSQSRGRDVDMAKGRQASQPVEHGSRHEYRVRSPTPSIEDYRESRRESQQGRSRAYSGREEHNDRHREDREGRGDRTRSTSVDSKRGTRYEKDKYRSSRSQRDRSRDRRHRHRSRSVVDDERYSQEDEYESDDREHDSHPRRRHRDDRDRRDRSRDKSRDRSRDRSREKNREKEKKDRRTRDRDYEYEREKERSREKDKERRRRRDRDRDAEDDRGPDDDKRGYSRRSRRERDRDRDERDKRDRTEQSNHLEQEEDVVRNMMKKRSVSPPLNAPTGPAANGFSIKGRSKSTTMPPPVAPRHFQPPKGPAADRTHDRSDGYESRRDGSIDPQDKDSKPDHYAAEREKNARERNSRDNIDKSYRDSSSRSLHTRIATEASSHPSLSSKRSHRELDTDNPAAPTAKSNAPTGPAASTHRDKRRKPGSKGDDGIAGLFTAGLRKNAKARRGGVRTEGDVEREMERVERERGRR